MTNELINERGVLTGSRINVYNLLPYFLDATVTEAYICREYNLTPEQVAATRAFAFNNADRVLMRHLEIEARNAAENSPELNEQLKKTHANFLKFKAWLDERKRKELQENVSTSTVVRGQTYREWRAEQESRPEQTS